MAKTRQENLNQVFGSMDKFGKKLDIIADKLDGINNQLSNSSTDSTKASKLTKEKNELAKKELKILEDKVKLEKKQAEEKEKQAKEDKVAADDARKNKFAAEDMMKSSLPGIQKFAASFGDLGNLVAETALNMIEQTDFENDDLGKNITTSIGGMLENIGKAGTDDFKSFDREASDKKRLELERKGASKEDLKTFDTIADYAEYTSLSMENVEKTMTGITDLGNEIIKPLKEIPVLGPMISGALDKGLSVATGKIKEQLVNQIFAAGKGTKGIQKGFLGTIPPINMMGTSIHIATAGISLLIGLLVAAAAALIGMTKRARDFAGEANIAFGQSFKLQGAITKADIALFGTGKSAKDISKQLIENFGTIDNVTSNNIKKIGQMSTRFGVATDDLIKFQKGFSDVTGASMDVANDVVRAVGSMASGAGVAAGAVIKDISSNMEAFARFSTEGASGMAKAASEAAKIGSNLGEVVKMADALLNFESSITAEFEAQVLTGKALNLEKAREAALQGDFATLTQEIQQQVGGLGNLQAMNVIQKDSIATALGISVAELTKIARGEAIDNEDTPELKEQKKTNQILIDGFTGNKESLDNLGKKSADSSGGMFGDFL